MLQKTCLFCLTKIYGVRFTLWILTTTYKLYTKRDPHNARMRSRYALGRSKILSSFSPFVDQSSQNKVGMCRRRLFSVRRYLVSFWRYSRLAYEVVRTAANFLGMAQNF